MSPVDRGGGLASVPPMEDPPALVAIPRGGRGRGALLGIVLGAAAFSFARASVRPAWHDINRAAGAVLPGAGERLATATAFFGVQPASSRITVRPREARTYVPISLGLVVDGVREPLPLLRLAAVVPTGAHAATTYETDLELRYAGGEAEAATLGLTLLPADDALRVELVARAGDKPHAVQLEASFPTGGQPLFVAGKGEIADAAEVTGGRVILEGGRPLAIVAPAADAGEDALSVTTRVAPSRGAAASLDVAVRTAAARGDGDHVRASFTMVLGRDDSELSRLLCTFSEEKCGRVFGRVTGTRARARITGLGPSGAPVIRATSGDHGAFDLEVPEATDRWYAALDTPRRRGEGAAEATETSAPLHHEPGWSWELRLNVAAGGELAVRVVDPDLGKPVTARVIVRGTDGTLDPNFGPDYRASGAGPLFDALRGEADTPLPAGRYRVAATKGIEWSVDEKTIEIAPGRKATVELHPRHVIATPDEVSCDLHVHARPSFDTPVTTEDRVISLVAAGIDFAVPTEHNIVGDYAPALEILDLTHDLASVTGVEITTFQPQFGHFGLFPYPKDERVPPFRGTTVADIIAAARKDGDPDRVLQINHPRLEKGLGYFDIYHFDPEKPPPSYLRTDFDAIEVYNGYEIERPERVSEVLRDWFGLLRGGRRIVATGSSDSHRIQYHWAGYPRTIAKIPTEALGDAAGGAPALPLAVVRAVKRGHSTISTGPFIDLELTPGEGGETARPGDDLVIGGGAELEAHVVVRAAPWIDVTDLEIVVDGEVAYRREIVRRELRVGDEPGDADTAEKRTTRFDGRVRLTVPAPLPPQPGGAPKPKSFVVAIVRGRKRLDEVLPYMPFAPMAFTNPVWLTR